MQMLSLENELKENAYPGRGIVIGKTPNGKYAVTAYFIMGRNAKTAETEFLSKMAKESVLRHLTLLN